MTEQPLYTASKETLRHVAEMAGVRFTEEELDQLAPQVTSLLADLSTLNELDLSQVEPALMFQCSEEPGHGS